MHAEMRQFRQVSTISLARVAAIYYALGGLLTLITDLAIGMEKLTVKGALQRAEELSDDVAAAIEGAL
jgi:hypothetical protein